MITVRPDQEILVVSENGYGKRSSIEDYRITNRGGKGVKTINVTEKTGNLIDISAVTDNDHLMITNKSGLTIRLAVESLRVMGRATQGVRLINLRDDDLLLLLLKLKMGLLKKKMQHNSTMKMWKMLPKLFLIALKLQAIQTMLKIKSKCLAK
jgi:hypothetical protein